MASLKPNFSSWGPSTYQKPQCKIVKSESYLVLFDNYFDFSFLFLKVMLVLSQFLYYGFHLSKRNIWFLSQILETNTT